MASRTAIAELKDFSSTANFLATAITARFFPLIPPRSASFSPQHLRPRMAQNVVRTLHQQRAQIRIAFLADRFVFFRYLTVESLDKKSAIRLGGGPQN